jgi:hypothetical protein
LATVDVPGGRHDFNGINASGQPRFMSMPVADFTATSAQGSYSLDLPGSISCAGFLTVQNVVVGVYRDADSTRHGFIWSKAPLPPTTPRCGSAGDSAGINDHAEVVGTYVDAIATDSC